jgi:hypothetical protein
VPDHQRLITICLPRIDRKGLGGGAERVVVPLGGDYVRAARPTNLALSVVHSGSGEASKQGVPQELEVLGIKVSFLLWQ